MRVTQLFKTGRLMLSASLFALMAASFIAGCGGGGDGGTSAGPEQFAGRYAGSFTESGSSPLRDRGTFVLTVGQTGAASAFIASFASADTIEGAGSVAATGALSNLSGTVATGGITYTFTGSIVKNHNSATATGTWTASGGAGGARSGTWSAAPAPTTNPYAGNYTGRIEEDGSTFAMTVHNDCTITGSMSPATSATRHHRAGHVGVIDPATGQFSWNTEFSSSGGQQGDVSRAILGVLELIVADAEASGIEVSEADRAFIRALKATISEDDTATKELTKIVNESGTVYVQPGPSFIYTGGTTVGDSDDGEYSQGFLSYDTSSIPLTATIVEAKWEITQNSTAGNPFALGTLYAEPATFNGQSGPGSGTIPGNAKIVSNSLVNGPRIIDVTDLVRARTSATRFQLRLRFPNNTNSDPQADRIVLSAGTLTIKYR